MSPKAFVLSCILLLFSSAPATAFNITRLLERFPEFSTFNQYLNETHLNQEINRRATITVLAVNNGAVSSALSGKSTDVVKRMLSTHVVLDYFDVPKLQKLKGKTGVLTTMYQSSGIANGQQGFLNATQLPNGDIVFGSNVKGAPLMSKLLKLVAAQPYNISVLEVSSVIYIPGIDGNFSAPPPPPASHAPAPAPTKKKSPVAPSPVEAEAPEAESPAEAAETPEEAPAKAPTPDAPTSSPPEGPPADAADAPAPSKSSGSRATAFSLCIAAVMGLVSAL